MSAPPSSRRDIDSAAIKESIRQKAKELGFAQVGISDCDLAEDEASLLAWLEAGYHGELEYMSRHGLRRSRPEALVPGTCRIISVRMDYRHPKGESPEEVLARSELGYISRYALGRDYHKLIRRRLQRLADHIEGEVGPFGYRAFADSAPVMEKPLARNAGLGWIGKHTNLIACDAGSWFFLGELYTDLPLEADARASDHCGRCRACIDACPTGAIVAPYRLDARRCISYLTIELKGSIPPDLRPLIGNRIFGCDDCQLVCPWNRFARIEDTDAFSPRHGLDASSLVELFAWSSAEYERRTEGMALRRIGYERWLRNIAVALGNAPSSERIVLALKSRIDHPSAMVREHIAWALGRHAADPSA
ncbi:MAG: tRNA epoxyqueuosine(34) reductase QueG [Ectothiorhodospiraceae bacterium AqS1]|nr:tRNA epoxyqueuosine(34) reductase QueG [Ectothiorhodospiraceae bacterium AqS1]